MTPADTRSTPRPDDLIPARDAARLVDRSLSSIRAWLRAGELTTWRGPGPASNAPTLVSRAELLALVVERGKAADPPRAAPAPATAAAGDNGHQLRADLDRLRVEVAELRAGLAVAAAERAGALAVVEAQRATVAALEARARDLVATVEAERARTLAAEAERDALRADRGLPWWRRLLGVSPALPGPGDGEH